VSPAKAQRTLQLAGGRQKCNQSHQSRQSLASLSPVSLQCLPPHSVNPHREIKQTLSFCTVHPPRICCVNTLRIGECTTCLGVKSTSKHHLCLRSQFPDFFFFFFFFLEPTPSPLPFLKCPNAKVGNTVSATMDLLQMPLFMRKGWAINSGSKPRNTGHGPTYLWIPSAHWRSGGLLIWLEHQHRATIGQRRTMMDITFSLLYNTVQYYNSSTREGGECPLCIQTLLAGFASFSYRRLHVTRELS